jgi:copper chaperone CopZ
MMNQVDNSALASAQVVYIGITGMDCVHCAARVRNALLELDGVLRSDVLLEETLALVAYDPERISLPRLQTAVATAAEDQRHPYQARLLMTLPAVEVFGNT